MGEMNESQVQELVTQITGESQFRERNTEWSEARRLVFREREVVIPGTTMEAEYRTPELLEAADKYTARFLGAPFTVNVSAQGPGPKAEMKAQAMENYDYRLLTRWWSQGLFHGPIHDMVGVTGEGWVHLTLNRSILPVIPREEDYDNPEAYLKRAKEVLDEFTTGERADLLQIEPIREPESIYYTPDKSVIFSAIKVPLPPLQKQYGKPGAGGLWGEKGKAKGINVSNGAYEITSLEGAVEEDSWNASLYSNTVLLYVVEDADYIYHLIEDAGGGKKHALGCYKNIFGAPGFVNVQGRTTNHPSAKFAVHPLTHAAMAIAPLHNITATIVYSGGILGEMQRVTLEPLPGDEAARERKDNRNLEIELLGNRVVKFPDGYKAVQPNIGVNADTLQAHAQLEAKMVQYGYPQELGNPADADATSGYQQAVMRDTVANIIDPPLANIAAMLNRLLTLKDTGIKTLDIPVTFRNFAPTDDMGKVARSVMDEITIDPDDIVEVDREVSFDSLTLYARQAKIELGRTLLAEGRITEDMFLRDFMGIDDPLRLKRQRLIEKAQAIAEETALKAATALFGKVSQAVAAEATVNSGIAPFVQPDASMGGDPLGGTYTSNGAGGPVPLEPKIDPASALGQSAGAGAMG